MRRQTRFAARLRRGQLVVEIGQPAPKPPRNWLEGLLGSLIRDPGVETGHCAVTSASYEDFRRAELAFLARHIG